MYKGYLQLYNRSTNDPVKISQRNWTAISPKKMQTWQTSTWKYSLQGNKNQNDSEIPLHTHYDGYN